MDLDKEVFSGKKISEIIKEAYDKHQEQDSLIKNEILRLSDMISSPGEALAISPMIKPLIDSSLKNDEVLLKIVQILQKSSAQDAAALDNSVLTEKDIEQLFSEVTTYTKPENRIKELPNSE